MENETTEPPELLTNESVIYWSEHFKKLEGCDGGKAIQTKAKLFLEADCIEYFKDIIDPRLNCFICKPLKGYNKTTYHLPFNKITRKFDCSCQYYQTKLLKKEEPYCSHSTALYLFLKIQNWNKRHIKTSMPSAEII